HCSLTSKDIVLLKKKKEEKDRILFSKHHSMRISQALSLMNEMLSETVALSANEHRCFCRTRSPQECRKQHIVSTKGGNPTSCVLAERRRTAAKPSSGQKGHHFTPALGLTHSRGKN
ncbi:CPLN1 protein, partial [Penelope pileata]|nr:CPLN1 protein [Penelope pileata]